MPLDDIFMLPKRVRTMEQMADLLQAERLMIERLEAVLAELTRQGSINNNTPLTKQRLEEISSLFANNPCRVDEFPDKLTIHIVVSRKDGFYTSWKEIVAGVDVLIPAHLKYLIVFELPVTVRIGVKASGYKIPYDLCGDGYAGELPRRNLVGTQYSTQFPTVEARGYPYQYDFCGTDYCGEEGV